MKKIAFMAGALMLMASTAVALAAPRARGASEFSPGDRMRDTGRPASTFAPGQLAKQRGALPANEFAPGDRMNDTRKRR
jgi:hypothetical protein